MNEKHVNTGVRKILEVPSIYNLKGIVFGGRHYKKNYVRSMTIAKDSKILDIGCGTASILEHLPSDIEYHGVDMERSYIEHCQKKYGKIGKFYHERVGEVIRPNWMNYFDIINIHGLIHHLSDEDSIKLMELAFQYLKKGGTAYTADSVFHDDQSILSRLFVSLDRGQNIRTPHSYMKLGRQFFEKVTGEVITGHIRIPYSIFLMKLVK